MNLIFNASAGTGKTWQVTELYSALVLGRNHEHLPNDRKPIDPRRILLMTFTDNAAAELRVRVSEKMLAAEKAALGNDDELADRARRVLRSMPAASISTIHAFCAGLIREHALELGLSPAFQTLEDEARDALLNDVLRGKIFQSLETDTDFRDFCSGISILGSPDNPYSLINTVRSLLEKAASRGLDLVDAEAMLPPPQRTVCRQSFERIRDELDASGLSQKTVSDALDALNECLSGFPAGLDGLKKFGRIKAVQHLSDELFELKERFLTEYYYEQNFHKFSAFARYLAVAACGFAEAKRSRDAVDFGDQLLMARDLLRSGKFKALFDWIIVDEVQDTSRVQCDVIEALWGNETHLVICGDKKQSIYAWRSADPQVMPDLEKAIAQRGGHKRIDLKTSYRSKERVIDAVNALFGGVYTHYDALESQTVLEGEGPCVEFLMQDHDDSTTDDEMAAVARRIRLLVDGGAEWRPKFGHDGKTFTEGEPFRYGDILILLKRSTHQATLEKALRDAGIPYTSGGKGYALFEQQEVRDLLLFLQVLCEPTNDLALIGFLRSPFANVPDDELVKMGWDGETFDHEILRKQFLEIVGHGCHFLRALPRNNEASLPQVESRIRERVIPCPDEEHKLSEYREACPTSVRDVAERIVRYREQTGDKLASQLIREMVRETAFDAQLAGLPGGEQRLANFKKALDWIRAAERGGQVLLPDVVRLFEKYIKMPPRSGAAEALLPDPEQNAVTLMTVHSAKGLTKRVCFVPDISFGDQSDKGFAVFSANTLELKLTGLSGEEVKSPGWDATRKADKAVRDLESMNVFYVAMTRARDLVVLSGAGIQKPDGWLKLSEAFLQSAGPEVLRKLSFAEMPEIKGQESGVRGQESGVTESVVSYIPLRISAEVERRTVTSLVKGQKSEGRMSPKEDRREIGILGHMVLEELAKNNWAGDIPKLLQLFGGDNEELVKPLVAAREVFRKETAGATALFTEHPFVLKRGNVMLDGTIDLLAQFPDGWKIFDYKFTNETPESALELYSPQLEAYREAVQKLHPGTTVSAALALIGESVKIISADL